MQIIILLHLATEISIYILVRNEKWWSHQVIKWCYLIKMRERMREREREGGSNLHLSLFKQTCYTFSIHRDFSAFFTSLCCNFMNMPILSWRCFSSSALLALGFFLHNIFSTLNRITFVPGHRERNTNPYRSQHCGIWPNGTRKSSL